jgi:hypothetical protein
MKEMKILVGFGVLTPVIMKNNIFWDKGRVAR